MSPIDTIKQDIQDKAQAAGAPLVGELTWWSMSKVEENTTAVEDIINDLRITDPVSGEDITAKDVCPKLQDRGGLMKALAELGIRPRAGRKKAKGINVNGAVLRPTRLTSADDESLSAGSFAVALVDESVSNGALGYVERQRVTYNSDTRQLSFSSDLLKAEISQGFVKYAKTYRSADIARIISNIIDRAQGILARPAGGVYFIPAPKAELANAISDFCSKVSGVELTRWAIFNHGTEQSKREVQQTMVLAGRALRKELEELKEQMVEMQAQAADPDGATLRGSTVTRRIDAYKVLREKARTYRELLGLADERMREELNELTRAAKELVHGKAPA